LITITVFAAVAFVLYSFTDVLFFIKLVKEAKYRNVAKTLISRLFGCQIETKITVNCENEIQAILQQRTGQIYSKK